MDVICDCLLHLASFRDFLNDLHSVSASDDGDDGNNCTLPSSSSTLNGTLMAEAADVGVRAIKARKHMLDRMAAARSLKWTVNPSTLVGNGQWAHFQM